MTSLLYNPKHHRAVTAALRFSLTRQVFFSTGKALAVKTQHDEQED